MRAQRGRWAAVLGIVVVLVSLPAVDASPVDPERTDTEAPPEEPASVAGPQDEQDADEEKEKKPRFAEKVVVSASAVTESPLDAPAAVDVISGEQLENRPADGIADQLRRVPGINVIQFSARDVNIASRGASGGINNSTLTLSDGRSLYQDFLGFTMWEFAPADASLIDRIEVVRGPASSLWGANAVGGVVHVITKSPRETLGGLLTLEGGTYSSRRVEFIESFLAGDWAVRASAGYHESDAFPRPATIVNLFGETIDPDLGLLAEGFRDSATRQPRVDLRADIVLPAGGEWILQGGSARTRGWIATGLGPFDVSPDTSLSYAQARFRRGVHEAQVDVNHFDGDARNGINGIPFAFTAASSHTSYRGRALLGGRGVVGWGAEGKLSAYDLSIAPNGDRRTLGAAFAEIDLGLAARLRLIAGARLDHVEETIGTVFSPRAALQLKPGRDHTVRLAAGRAFRSPSVIESDLDVPAIPVALLDWEEIDRESVGFPFFALMAEGICGMTPDNCGVPPGEIPQYVAVTSARGSRGLDAVRTDSLELGYAGRLGPFGLQATVYRTRSRNGIDFPWAESYGFGPDGQPGTADDVVLPSDPDGDGIDEAPEIDVCPFVDFLLPFRDLCPRRSITYNHFLSIMLDGQIPSLFQYANGSGQDNRGIELGFDWTGPAGLFVYASYSWQDDPEIRGVPMGELVSNAQAENASGQDLDGDGRIAGTNDFVNIPAEHRLSLGAQFDTGRWFGALTLDHVDRTFWQDVLTSDFWGFVSAYELVGLRAGRRWPSRNLQATLQITNLLDDPIQQHIYGDVIERRITLGLTYGWGGVARSYPGSAAGDR